MPNIRKLIIYFKEHTVFSVGLKHLKDSLNFFPGDKSSKDPKKFETLSD